MYNAADLATEFCRYHLSLGVDKIFVAGYGSDDGTLDLLSAFVRERQVQLVPVRTHHFAEYDPSNAILELIRKEDAADWASFLDPDGIPGWFGECKSLSGCRTVSRPYRDRIATF
jgi:hypothetical protein